MQTPQTVLGRTVYGEPIILTGSVARQAAFILGHAHQRLVVASITSASLAQGWGFVNQTIT